MSSRSETICLPLSHEAQPGACLLETQRLAIRRYHKDNIPALAKAANHAAISPQLSGTFPYPYTEDDAAYFINELALKPQQDLYPRECAIFTKADTLTAHSAFVGGVALRPGTDVKHVTWELGYWLTPTAWGQGYGTELAMGITRWCFDEWPHVNRIEAEVYVSNEASARVLEKCGFVREGTKRGAVEKGGVIKDVYMFGLVRSDVRIRREGNAEEGG